jgi:hypothetical protein
MLKLVITISKKVPGPQDYSSTQSSVSIEGELASGQDPVAEAARLQSQAEAAVDRFLGLSPAHTENPAPQQSRTPAPTLPPRTSPAPPNSGASRPYAQGRRAPAPITESQVSFIGRLLTESRTTLDAVLAHFQVGSLRDLSAKQGSELIDSLKSKVPA